MFKSLRLKNFKAYKDSGDVPLAPLTIIVGANNSGKSTLFHALLALVQSARGADQGNRPRFVTKGIVDLNGFFDILHKRHIEESPSFELSIGLDGRLAPATHKPKENSKPTRFEVPDRLEMSFGLDKDRNEILVERSTFSLGNRDFLSVERQHGEWSLLKSSFEVLNETPVDFVGVFPFIWGQASGTEAVMRITHFCASVWMSLFAKNVSNIAPLRARVPWYASIGARATSEFGLGGENLVGDLGSKEKDSRTKKTRLELVNDWLSKREILKRVRVETDKNAGGGMLVGDEWNGPRNINIAAMGEGVSQILPIIAYSLFGMRHDCLLVEQPEIHLHPALQAELGDLFIDVAQTGQRQILVETHSEHLLLRVRRRIAEGKLKPDQVAILFVEKEGGESTVRRLDLNARGHFSDWPKGFFDEAYQEAMALAAAAAKKG